MTIDKLCYSSGLRYVNTGEKITYTMLTLILNILAKSMLVAVLVLVANSVVTVRKGGISLKRYLKLLTLPVAFLVLSTLTLIVNLTSSPLDGYAIVIGSHYLTGSSHAIGQAGSLIMIALAAVSCLYFLALSTPLTDILVVLKWLRCPMLLLELLLLIYRFIFILWDTAMALEMSFKARRGDHHLRSALRSYGQLLAALFIGSIKRSRAMFEGLESRCYDGTIRILKRDDPVNWRVVGAIIGYEALLITLTIWRWRS